MAINEKRYRRLIIVTVTWNTRSKYGVSLAERVSQEIGSRVVEESGRSRHAFRLCIVRAQL